MRGDGAGIYHRNDDTAIRDLSSITAVPANDTEYSGAGFPGIFQRFDQIDTDVLFPAAAADG